MHAIAFTAGQFSDFLFLIWPAEIKLRYIGARVQLFTTHLQDIVSAADFRENGCLRIERIAVLVDIPQFNGRADPHSA